MPAKRKTGSSKKEKKEDTNLKRSKDEMEQPEAAVSVTTNDHEMQESKKPKFTPPEPSDLHQRIQWNTNYLWDSSVIQNAVRLFSQPLHLEISFFESKNDKTWRRMIKLLDQYHFVEYYFSQSLSELSQEITLLIVQILNQRIRRLGSFHLENDSPNTCKVFFEQFVQLPHSTHTLLFFSNCLVHTLHLPHWRSHIMSLLSLPMWLNIFPNSSTNQELYHQCFSTQPKLIKLFSKMQSNASNVKWEDQYYIWSLLSSLSHWIEQQFVEKNKKEEEENLLLLTALSMLIDCLSQIPTRRFIITVLQYWQLHIRCHVLLSKQLVLQCNALQLLLQSLEYYLYFPMDKITNVTLNQKERIENMAQQLDQLQHICFSLFGDKIAFSVMNHSQIVLPHVIKMECQKLSVKELQLLLHALHLPLFQCKEELLFSMCVQVLIAHVQSLQSTFPYVSMDLLLLEPMSIAPVKVMPTFLSLEDYLMRLFILRKNSTSAELKEQVQILLESSHLSSMICQIDSMEMESPVKAKVKCTLHDKQWVDHVSLFDHLLLVSLTEDKKIKQWKWCQVRECVEESVKEEDTTIMIGTDSVTCWVELHTPLQSDSQFEYIIKLNTNQQSQLAILKQLYELLRNQKEEESWFVDTLLGFATPKEEEEKEIDLYYLFESSKQCQEYFPNSTIVTDTTLQLSSNQIIQLHQKPKNHLLTEQQIQCVMTCLLCTNQCLFVPSIPGTGYTQIVNQLLQQFLYSKKGKTLLIAKYPQLLKSIFASHLLQQLPIALLNRICILTEEEQQLQVLLQRRNELLHQVSQLLSLQIVSCEQSHFYNVTHVQQLWQHYVKDYPQKEFPFANSTTTVANLEEAKVVYEQIQMIFEELESLRPLEWIRDSQHRLQFVIQSFAQVIAVTSDQFAANYLHSLNCHFENVIIMDSHLMSEMECIPLLLKFTNSKQTKRMIWFGDVNQSVHYQCNTNNEQVTFFERMTRMQSVKQVTLNQIQPNTIVPYWKDYYSNLQINSVTSVNDSTLLKSNCLFIDSCAQVNANSPTNLHHLNLGEAELIVLFYMYLRLHSIPSSDIVILTNTNLQKKLILEVMEKRGVIKNVLFGMPHFVGCVEEWGSQQSRVVLVSTVYTKGEEGFGKSFCDQRKWLRIWSSAMEQLYLFGNVEHWKLYPHITAAQKQCMQTNEELKLKGLENQDYSLLCNSTNIAMVKQMGTIIKEMTRIKLSLIAKEQQVYANQLQAQSLQQLKKK